MCDASAWASNHVARSRRRARAIYNEAGPAHSSTCWTSRPITSVNLAPQSGRLLRDTFPPFSVNTLIKKALGRPGVDDHLETIFARGIDPESEAMSIARGNPAWPSRAEVRQYVEAADRLIEQAIERADLERPGDPLLDHGRALWTILEHEEMHQKRSAISGISCPTRRSANRAAITRCRSLLRTRPRPSTRVSGGFATLGTDLREDVFAWDNECPLHRVHVNEFSVDVYNVTNGQFMEFVQAGGYQAPQWWRPEDWAWIESAQVSHPSFWEHDSDRWFWRGMFERVPLPETWPIRHLGGRRPTHAGAGFVFQPVISTRGVRRPKDASAASRGETVASPVPGNFDFTR